MSFDTIALPGFFAVRAGLQSEIRDIYACTREIAAAGKAQGQELLVLLILPEKSSPLDEAGRKAQAACLPEIFQHASHVMVVIEGDGFSTAIKRSALTAITLIARARYPYEVRSSVEDALVLRPPPDLRFDGRAALAELRRRGFAGGTS